MTAFRPFLGDALLLLGTAIITLAIWRVVRLPDVYAKLHAASKAVVVGVSMVLASSLAAGDAKLVLRAGLVAVLLLVTAPVGAHALARLHAELSAAKRDDGD